ncbi:hypothetical protein DL96DRAFT_1608012, partial [Flagelloscypha sp. PMI_526]
MSDQEVFPTEIYAQIIANISPTMMSAIIEHTRVMLAPRTSHSPLVESQNLPDLLALSLVSKSWLEICRCIFYSLIFTEAPEQVEKRQQLVQLLEHPLCTFREHIQVLVLLDPPSGSRVPSFVAEFLHCLAFLPSVKSLTLCDVDFWACPTDEWNLLSSLIFKPEQLTLGFIRCRFPAPDLLTINLARCSKLYSLTITAWDDPTVFGWVEPTTDNSDSLEESTPSSIGPSLKDINISALYPAFPGASTLQTMGIYLHQVCYSREKLEILKFVFHIALETEGQAQEAVDMLGTFIEQQMDGSVVRFVNINLMIFDDAGASFGKLARSISTLSNLEFLVLTLLPLTEGNSSFMRGTCERAEAFVLMMLESVVSNKLQTVFFMADSVSEVKDLASFNWAAFGKALARPEYANLESVVLDCTGKPGEWVEEAIPCLEMHVRGTYSTTYRVECRWHFSIL